MFEIARFGNTVIVSPVRECTPDLAPRPASGEELGHMAWTGVSKSVSTKQTERISCAKKKPRTGPVHPSGHLRRGQGYPKSWVKSLRYSSADDRDAQGTGREGRP